MRYDVEILDDTGTVIGTRTNLASGQAVDQLTNDTPYRFRVLAVNSVGVSDPSQPTKVIRPAGRPTTPTNVQATVESGPGEAFVTWNASDPNGDPITHYTVTARPDTGPPVEPRPPT